MTELTDSADRWIPSLRQLQRRLLVGGGIGALAALAGLWTNPSEFFEAYLIAYMFVLSLSLGCLAIGMLHQLSGGSWGVVIRRPIGAASRTLPILTVLFLPIVFGMHHLYEWTHADAVAADELLQHKQPYLNVPFFLARAAAYFLVWNTLSYLLNAWALEQDRTGNPRISRRMQMLSAGGLVAYGMTVTFASIDWLMSLDPRWFSTMFGVLIMGGQGLSAMAFLIAVTVWLSRRPPLDRFVLPAHLHDLGNLTLAFVMLWAYFAFSQYLLIWAGNLPEEIGWYHFRLQTGWRLVGLALVVFHFAAPFVLLLSRAVKRQARTIVTVAVGLMVARIVDLYWLVAPEFHRDGIALSWLELVLPVSLGALWLGGFVRQLRGRALLPVHDPQFEETLAAIAREHHSAAQ